MKKKTIILSLLIAVVSVAIYYTGTGKLSPTDWQSGVKPGKLSAAHTSLETNCVSCHTPVKGIDEAKCISCHANNTALIQRQPTVFHATIGNCATCHAEHQGVNANLRVMNHEALASLGEKLSKDNKNSERLKALVMHSNYPLVSSLEAKLDCASCHGTKDKHQGLFGQNCASCHATAQWTIPAFQHPSVLSTSCNSCHQAPPSHYMEHFEMVSMKVAEQENVVVSQCYKCHQTTSWNDIKGVGYYKHH
ncbi:hypothetical protein HRH25_20940 [Flavisolibacter sp. BT320]|nr:hypothetical protein [Flavisolibacter longurius]